MINRLLVLISSLYLAFMPVLTYAAGGEDWQLRRIQKAYQDEIAETRARVQAELTKTTIKNGSTITKTAIVETIPTATKVGGSMLKRVTAVAKTPGIQMVGVLAVTELIEAIGWVMEDGSYVKYKIENDPDNSQYVYYTNPALGTAKTPSQVCNLYPKQPYGQVKYESGYGEFGRCNAPSFGNYWQIERKPDPDYDPNKQKKKKIDLTADLLGAAMLGAGYHDPVDSTIDAGVNTGKWTSVPEAYSPDPSGVGNERYKEIETKADNASSTKDNQPSSLNDPKYKNDLSTNDAANDRSWTSDGTKGNSESSTSTDPETGNTTTTGSFQLPAFCDWASIVCDWYKDWKKTDEWVKDEPELKDEELQIDDEDLTAYERKDYIKFGETCPFSAQAYSIPMGFVGSLDFEADATIFCTYGQQARPFIIGLGYVGSLIYLLYALRDGNA